MHLLSYCQRPADYFQAYQGYITTKIADSPADQSILAKVAKRINRVDNAQLSPDGENPASGS